MADHSKGTVESYKHFTPTLDVLVRTMIGINKQTYTEGTKGRYFIETYLNCIKVVYGKENGFKTVELIPIDYDKNTFQFALQSAVECVITEQSK